MPDIITYNGGECGFGLGEFSAIRSLELHGRILCGECAQKEKGSAYMEWLEDQKQLKEMQAEAV
jgi:hypothetical protein